MNFKNIGCRLLSYINKVLPKFKRVVVEGFPNAESSAISVANYISRNYDIPVYFAVSNREADNPDGLLAPDIRTIDMYNGGRRSIKYLLVFMTSKYLFFTHGVLLDFFSDRQTVTNIWHGVLYKKVRTLIGNDPILADITVATSEQTKPMFSEAFGVTENKVFISGYPRNDMLLEAKKGKDSIKKSIADLSDYKRIAIWMPTYRKSVKSSEGSQDGVEVGNPFYINDFKVITFNNLLKENGTLCLVKPHPNALEYAGTENLSNIRFINDEWISDQGITLYQLLGATDLLISDVSSVIIDYMLMDQPIVCMSADFEEYRDSRGFYFEDIENWIPSTIISNQEDFFNYMESILSDGEDPSKEKREKLKKYFFDDYDAGSTKKLVEHAFNLKSLFNDQT
jgi:CDP-glycerol glycerophosphotransferase (TagB/SpsB family)